MSKPIVELITCDEGDWEVLKVNGDIFKEGHSITNSNWIDLIHYISDIKINETNITDDDMENGNY